MAEKLQLPCGNEVNGGLCAGRAVAAEQYYIDTTQKAAGGEGILTGKQRRKVLSIVQNGPSLSDLAPEAGLLMCRCRVAGNAVEQQKCDAYAPIPSPSSDAE